jgi:hypothetical protein
MPHDFARIVSSPTGLGNSIEACPARRICLRVARGPSAERKNHLFSSVPPLKRRAIANRPLRGLRLRADLHPATRSARRGTPGLRREEEAGYWGTFHGPEGPFFLFATLTPFFASLTPFSLRSPPTKVGGFHREKTPKNRPKMLLRMNMDPKARK